jgi:ATP-dependent DNA helicase RecQ
VESLEKYLHHYFGYETFRFNQKQIIENILSGNDTLALLPTGGGKSIIYQLPALISDGVCLVISPLLALMKDQVAQLEKKGIPAAYVSSDLTMFQQQEQLEKAQKQQVKLLYLSPERTSNYHFINALKYIKVSFIAIDEAHCISEWGNDFRPSYLSISDFRLQFPKIPMIALTATATKKTKDDIVTKLKLKNVAIFQNSFLRENLAIQMIKTDDKISMIVHLLKKYQGSGLIYCRTRKETEELYKVLKSKDLFVDYFHAGLSDFEKQKKQKNWTASNFQTLICTNAFGMGIDKSNVRLVIHASPSYSIENYYQEIGRAGRDSITSATYLLWSENEMENYKYQLINIQCSKNEYTKIVQQLFSRNFITEQEEFQIKTYPFSIEKLQKNLGISSRKINVVLRFLENASLIRWEKNIQNSRIKFTCHPHQINYLNQLRYQIIEYFSRSIMGAFSEEITFSEQDLSNDFLVSAESIHQELVQLHQENWIEYLPASQQSITFLKPRKDDYWISEMWKKFKINQENNLFKFRELEYLITQNRHCRTRLILGYFNEKTKENCGICDVCLQNSSINHHLSNSILEYIKENNRTLQELILEFTNHSKEEIIETIQLLLSEEKIKNTSFLTYCIN